MCMGNGIGNLDRVVKKGLSGGEKDIRSKSCESLGRGWPREPHVVDPESETARLLQGGWRRVSKANNQKRGRSQIMRLL